MTMISLMTNTWFTNEQIWENGTMVHLLMFTFLLFALIHWLFNRYNNDLELEDAIHTAILTLKVSGSIVFELFLVCIQQHWPLLTF